MRSKISGREQRMEVDHRLERLCERVTLVNCVGSRWRGELCVMSFVALLGGERHMDQPASASPLIRNFAMRVNDAMPRRVRQRLKPFAARILGTNDGHDRARVEVLRRALAGEIQPRIRRDWGIAGRAGERGRVPIEAFAETFCFADMAGPDIAACAALLLSRLERPLPPGHEPRVGAAVGEVLARCMREAATREQRGWYRDEAIDLLDRLCEVTPGTRSQATRDDRIARAEERLGWAWLKGTLRSVPAMVAGGRS